MKHKVEKNSSPASQLKKKNNGAFLSQYWLADKAWQTSSVLKGVDYVIEVDKTMNPSTEDFIKRLLRAECS